jgi:hypothetical protein
MYDGGVFLYESSLSVTLVQPGFNFRAYPNDEQSITIRYAIVNYDAYQLQIYPQGIYCSILSTGDCAFSQNPVWQWNENSDSCTVYYDPKGNSPIWPSYAEFQLSISRQGDGLIVRLVLPITLLLILSALTFWITYENRVDTTITILLSVSALYIVILQNIPMVGYLTNIDRFVFVVSSVSSLASFLSVSFVFSLFFLFFFAVRCLFCYVALSHYIKFTLP